MADTPTSITRPTWASVSTKINTLHQQLATETNDRRTLEEELGAAENELLDLPAPDLAGAIKKLELLWDGKLHGTDRDSHQKLVVIGDLRRVAAT